MASPDESPPPDWPEQREALRALHRDVLREPVPAALLAAASGRPGAGWRTMGLAAALLLAFVAGWGTHAQWLRDPAGSAVVASARGFAHDAAVAHAVYTPEKRHPVEVAAAEQQHLVQWLSRRLDRPLKVPDLSAQGYALVGGRLLPGDDGARAQFMFENPAGARVTLYLGAVNGPPSRETAFRFSSEGPVPSFYWVDQGFGYALSGPLSRDALLALATAVHRQI